MTTKSVWLIVVLSIAVVGILGAMACVFVLQNQFTPNQDALSVTEDISTTDIQNDMVIVGGSVVQGDVQTAEGMYYKNLTAVADEGYTFAYWQNANTKLSGDQQITLSATSQNALSSATNACVPVFVSTQNVFVINNLEDFNNTLVADISSDQTADKIYKLATDLTVSSLQTSTGVFRGVLDGNNHSINGFSVTGCGMFASVSGGVIKNLILSNGSITSTEQPFVGSFCGSINNGLISRCLSYLDLTNTIANGSAGGIVGSCSSTDVKSMLFSCGFYGTLNADNTQQMIANNGTISGTTSESCSVFRPKNNGATTN